MNALVEKCECNPGHLQHVLAWLTIPALPVPTMQYRCFASSSHEVVKHFPVRTIRY